MEKTKKLSGWRKALGGALGGLASLVACSVPGCGSDGKFVGAPSGYVETMQVSDYVARHGAAVRGQQRQDLVNINVNDRLSGFVWQDYSNKENAVCERDFGLVYSVPLTKELSAKISPQYWSYPTGTFGNYDAVVEGGLSYKGPVRLDFSVTQLMRHDETDFGTRYHLKASKDIPLLEDKKHGIDVTLTPNVHSAVIEDYYGRSGWFSQFTTGINLGVNKKIKSMNLGFNLFVNQQFGNAEGIESFTWGGVSLGFSW